MTVWWPVSALLIGAAFVVLVCCVVNLSLEPGRMAGHWSARVGEAAFLVVMTGGLGLIAYALAVRVLS